MRAMKCDRCGKFFDFYTITFGSGTGTGNAKLKMVSYCDSNNCEDTRKKLDLCKECAEEFINWIDSAQNGGDETQT